MTYEKKLLASKILITLGLSTAALIPLMVDFGPSHIASEQWPPHARFHLTWALLGNLFALPILLFAVWSGLHGTGRSVRLAAFLGMASMAGFFTASAFRDRFGAALHDPGHQHMLFGMDADSFVFAVIFILLSIGVLLSIRPSSA